MTLGTTMTGKRKTHEQCSGRFTPAAFEFRKRRGAVPGTGPVSPDCKYDAAGRVEPGPPFAQMVGQLFGHADSQQKSGIIGTLLGGLGAAAHPALAQAGINASPEQAAQLSTDQVQQIATQAQQANPGVVAQMSSFYAQHPVLVKSLGAAAMAIVLGRMRSPGR
jgi:hypothetical protein